MITALPRRLSPQVDEQVRDERIRQLYRHGTTTITGAAAVAALLCASMWPRVAHSHVLTWAAVFLFITMLRYGLILLHARAPERYTTAQWERFFTVGAFAAGCSWGLDTVWLFPAGDLPYQFWVAIVGMGLGSGASTSLSAALPAFLAFLLPAMLPVAARLLAGHANLAHVAGFAALVYCAAMVSIGRNNARMMSTALRLRFTNLELAHELEVLATRDSLTGLPNRLIFVERLTGALKRADRGEHDVAIAFVDCDGFKKINDTYGHQTGDEYLKRMAEALQSCVREVDTVARLGGDEFIVLLERCGDKATVERIIERVLAVTEHDMQFGSIMLRPRFSVGVTCYPRDGTDAELLIHQADEAMYAAKRGGGNRFCFFAPPVTAVANT